MTVSKPRGVSSIRSFWNVVDDAVPWVAGLAEVSGSEVIGPRDTPASARTVTATAHLPTAGASAFASAEQADFPHVHRRTADSLVATLATRAGVLVMTADDRDARLSRIRAYLASRPETAEGEFDLPMRTSMLRVRSTR